MPKKSIKISSKVVPRLSRYYRILYELDKHSWVSSKSLSESTGFSAAQIRKDLAYFGQFGSRGKGYNSDALKKSIRKILGLDRTWNVALIGAGNLGMALLGYRGFRDQGFKIVAAFDVDKKKIGKTFNEIKVYNLKDLDAIVRKKNIHMAMLTVPGEYAQKVAESVVRSGIKAILNFAPTHLKLPENVKVRHIDMTIEIERLSFLISRQII
jgi:redox-sensing transcriptional repressor